MIDGSDRNLEELILTTWRDLCAMGLPEEILLNDVDNKVEEYEMPILGGIDSVMCESLRFMLETPDKNNEIFYVVLDFDKDETSLLNLSLIFPHMLAYFEEYGSLGVLELENRLKETIIRQAIEILKEHPEFKKYREALKSYNYTRK
ncbi:hypothetical protein [Bacillus sp. MRMR6]|uniref:hypothetical protein n=1 Tax=Bacillus sp. MRMR6 TaxID=1928617 RepID=UPI000952EE3B|nr:hypothetical protein [Bacillus sp. MRMR6]OLS37721.1 hypothetical protein BTR25_15505 [Bacillus sp. MRMR6]